MMNLNRQSTNKKKPTIISKLFSTYNETQKEEELHRNGYIYDIADYIMPNKKHIDYMEQSIRDLEFIDQEENYFLQSECFYMCETEVKGILRLQRDRLYFKSR